MCRPLPNRKACAITIAPTPLGKCRVPRGGLASTPLKRNSSRYQWRAEPDRLSAPDLNGSEASRTCPSIGSGVFQVNLNGFSAVSAQGSRRTKPLGHQGPMQAFTYATDSLTPNARTSTLCSYCGICQSLLRSRTRFLCIYQEYVQCFGVCTVDKPYLATENCYGCWG
jgi:hypothetical protein